MKRGELVQYYRPRGGWRLARFHHVVARGRRFGLVLVIPTCVLNGKKVYLKPENVKPENVKPENVKPLVEESAAALWWAKRPKIKAKVSPAT